MNCGFPDDIPYWELRFQNGRYRAMVLVNRTGCNGFGFGKTPDEAIAAALQHLTMAKEREAFLYPKLNVRINL